MLNLKKITLLAMCLTASSALAGQALADARNIVLVHGLNMDGGAWRSVYKQLSAKDYNVTVVQMPMTSIEADVAAVRRAIDVQEGPIVLAGHSYGGMVISQAGIDPDVKALVYIAAFQPEVGESLGFLNASIPAELPAEAIKVFDDGYYLVEPETWIADVANGTENSDAEFTANFQAAANTSIFGYEAENAAWKNKPSWALVPTNDRTVSPELQQKMASRSGAQVQEIDAGHLVHMSNPDEVTALIESAAASVD